MPKVRILQQAAKEAEAAVAWYENERPGLGAEFSEAIEAAIDVVEDGSFRFLLCLDTPATKVQSASFFAASHTT